MAQASWRPAEDEGTTIKADHEALYGPWLISFAQWRKDWVKVSGELAQDC